MSQKSVATISLIAYLAVAASILFFTRGGEVNAPAAQRLSLRDAMSPDLGSGFLRAEEPIPFEFPRDHGPHVGFQTEWWYLVGNLEASGRRLGYQITFFRSALRPPDEASENAEASAWSTDEIFMAHLAVTDAGTNGFWPFERFSRGALDLAGASAAPFRVWLEDWSLEGSQDSLFPLRIRAAQDDIELDLVVEEGKPVVLQGDRGWSRKGLQPGNASYYYSFTRLPTTGSVRLRDETLAVRGQSWMDREWSTSALEETQEGWDWFALQLDDGRDLMVYRMRQSGGGTDPLSAGVIVEPDGSHRRLAATEFDLQVTDSWRSGATGIEYPSVWRISSSLAEVDLSVEPLVADQEHAGSVVYWEGAVVVRGTSRGQATAGRGYMELTGYAPGG